MDIGIPLSQLASQHPIPTGSSALDLHLEGGFKPGCIYEIYGPPGSCKEIFLSNLLANCSSDNTLPDKTVKSLVIQTHKPVVYSRLGKNNNNSTYTTRITKFSQLLRFVQVHQSQNSPDYGVLVIDDFAQLLVDHTNFSRRTSGLSASTAAATNVNANANANATANADYPTKRLNLLLSLLTKYATKHNTIILLVDHCTVTQREYSTSPSPNLYSNLSSLKKGLLTTALEWGNALNGKNAIGAKLLKLRLGFFWDWKSIDPINDSTNSRKPVIVVIHGGATSRPDERNSDPGVTTTFTISCDGDTELSALTCTESRRRQRFHVQEEMANPVTIQESQ